VLAVILYCLATVSCPVVGGIVVIRRPGHPAGWLLIGIGAGWLLTTTADALVSVAGVERQQMKFFGCAVILVIIALVPVKLLPVGHGWLIWFFLALNSRRH
jgi:hypothetical protein